jgi:hypothetical protein
MASAIVRSTAGATVRWQDGRIGGDTIHVGMIGSLADHPREVALTPTGPWFSTVDALDDPWAFVATALEVLGPDASFEETGLPDPYGSVGGERVES